MEQKKNDREARGNKGWSSQGRQQELDESDRLQVMPQHTLIIRLLYTSLFKLLEATS